MTDLRRVDVLVPWILLPSATAALGTALIAQFAFGYDPCVLCVYQRLPWAFIAMLGVAACFMAEPGQRFGIALLAVLLFLTGAGIALYHVGVEQTWWLSAAPCGSGGMENQEMADFLSQIQEKPTKSCGDIDWTFLGVSMATYNFVISLLLGLGMLWIASRIGSEDA